MIFFTELFRCLKGFKGTLLIGHVTLLMECHLKLETKMQKVHPLNLFDLAIINSWLYCKKRN